MLIRVLLCVRPTAIERPIRLILERLPDVHVERVAGRRPEPWPGIGRRGVDIVIIGRGIIPEPVTDSLRALRDSPDAPDVVVLDAPDDAEKRALLMAAGASDVLHPGLSREVLQAALVGLVRRRATQTNSRTALRPSPNHPRLSDFVSASLAMRTFMDVVHRVADSDTALLLLGETGAGKERLGRAIHAESRRSAGPFVALNCGALPEALLESELFGHEEGAFTGATRSRRGWFEVAHGGTLFLDEIGEMPLHLQVKLLRVLQDHEFQRIGGEVAIRVDVRVMAASNRDLAAEVEAGAFRRDLFYRLGVIALEIPALRERREDISDLATSYIEHFARVIGRDVEGIRMDAVAALETYGWPGNVRELMNAIERAVLLCDGSEITLTDLPESIRGPSPVARTDATIPPHVAAAPGWTERPLRDVRQEAVDACERAYLSALLEETRGSVGETARRAGIVPRSLFEKMRRLGLRKEDFRAGD